MSERQCDDFLVDSRNVVGSALTTTATYSVHPSGWGWLGYNKSTGRVEVATCPNQDPLEATTGLIPLLGIDVWEHAYYVDYRNVRPGMLCWLCCVVCYAIQEFLKCTHHTTILCSLLDYVKAIWEVINWDVAEKRLAAAK